MQFSKKKTSRLLALLLAAAALLAPLFTEAPAPGGVPTGFSAQAANVCYYPRYTGKSGSLVDALKTVGVNSSYANRKAIAALNGITNYTGTAAQNTKLLNLLKQGKLIKSVTQTPAPASDAYYPRYTGSSGSIVDALRAIGGDSSFANRKLIAQANGISDYSGTAAQNTKLLNLLKQGLLKKPGGAPVTPTPITPSGGDLIIHADYNVSVSNKALRNKPHYENAADKRSKSNYNTVIDQFKVASNSRYARSSGKTYCNIFAWDVTSAMKAEIPHWIYSNGKPANPGASGAKEINANATYNWLNSYGAAYGWKKVSAADAQKRANSGYPTIAIWKNPSGGSGHVAVVRPEGNGYAYSAYYGPVTAQAGAQNKNYINVRSGFNASIMNKVVYWTHN